MRARCACKPCASLGCQVLTLNNVAADVLALGRRFFGTGTLQNLTLHNMDGLDFISHAAPKAYDVIILDVSVPADGVARPVSREICSTWEQQGPPEAFLSEQCLDGAVWAVLADNAVLAINVLGPPAHVQAVREVARRCVPVASRCTAGTEFALLYKGWTSACAFVMAQQPQIQVAMPTA